MLQEIRNGKIAIINENKQESIDTLNDFLEELGIEPLSEKELTDWNISGGETNDQLKELARNLASEYHTEKCARKNAWRYEI